MSEWLEVTRRQRRHAKKSQGSCAVSRVAVRDVQDAVVPQQGHVPRLQHAEGRETGRVHQREVTDSGLRFLLCTEYTPVACITNTTVFSQAQITYVLVAQGSGP